MSRGDDHYGACTFRPPALSETYGLSLHDALPILENPFGSAAEIVDGDRIGVVELGGEPHFALEAGDRRGSCFLDIQQLDRRGRSEEHTSELQSQFQLVCRLLLEKKKRILIAGTTC